MDVQILFWLAPFGAVLALIFAYIFYSEIMASDPGSERSQEIAGFVKEGAMSYLRAQYSVVAMFFVAAFVFFAILSFVLHIQSVWTPIAFLTGGFFSGLSGYLGMKTATNASNRTAAAASKSLNQGLTVAFRAGAVMGFVVVGLGLLDISIWWRILNWVLACKDTIFKDSIFAVRDLNEITTIMLTFGMGASSQALFARVGGGIFTKAADVGADLVGKTEAGIPEDDPRNPAVIADNVGDNVGDVAGMGADLYESYCASILATAALGASAFSSDPKIQMAAIILPMVIAGIGIACSLFGVYMVNTHEGASQKELLGALGKGINTASALIAVGSFIAVYIMLPGHVKIYGSILSGLMAGIIIGWSTEYFTSSDYDPTKSVASQSTTGPATVIIEGFANGMMSAGLPVITVSTAVLLAYGFAGGFDDPVIGPAMGLYGIGISAVGMLATLGITLATDAYGPIADNAGGNAEMCHMNPEVRKRTDALDALGNTTAATGKGYAIGSAALTAMALLGAYVEELRAALIRISDHSGLALDKFIYVNNKLVSLTKATMRDFMNYYDITLMNPQVLVGVFLGAMLVFVFCAMTMKAVGRAAHSMVEEVRRQFKEIPGLLKGEPGAKADYAACVAISTAGAQREMVTPSLMAIIVPIFIGCLLGPSGIMGLLLGGMGCGFAVAIMMANAGSSWDNAKKFVESGQLGGKGSDCHKATVVGDTVGDPLKDTSGPSLNILIKLMSMVAVVVAGLTVSYSPEIQFALGFNPMEHRLKEEATTKFQEGQLKLPLEKGVASGTSEGAFDDEEDPLTSSDEAILPEDEEGLLGEGIASDVAEEMAAPVTGSAPVKPVTGGFEGLNENVKTATQGAPITPSKVKPSTGGSGFDAFDDNKKTVTPAASSAPATIKPSAGGSGFDALDDNKNMVTPAASSAPATIKPAGGFDALDEPAKPAIPAPSTASPETSAVPATSAPTAAAAQSSSTNPAPTVTPAAQVIPASALQAPVGAPAAVQPATAPSMTQPPAVAPATSQSPAAAPATPQTSVVAPAAPMPSTVTPLTPAPVVPDTASGAKKAGGFDDL
ncbi:MAG: sodium-translocating pyrophosphatase [Candidatus Riflebacteria bacterium]|nr:sodium-translocating pyrophosphatase [Candidatus Riflebacteria bacterium]